MASGRWGVGMGSRTGLAAKSLRRAMPRCNLGGPLVGFLAAEKSGKRFEVINE